VIGQTIARYRILEKLGQGGMGVVYKAEDLSLKRNVALKFIRPGREKASEVVERFKLEAQAAAALNHPNIVAVYDIGEHEGQFYISMEFVAGHDLGWLVGRGPLPVDRAMDIASQVGEALGRAHKRGIVHRDIKPENVILDEDGRAKVLDFGLAKVLGAASATASGQTLGTLAYMSPEQARGERVDHRADIWALGVLLYEMITGQRPFAADSAAAVVHAVLTRVPPPASTLRVEAPPTLDHILDRALAKDTQHRYQEMTEFLADLLAVELPPPGPRTRRMVADSRLDTQVRPPAPASLSSERRQISVMSCSLLGASLLNQPLDPEDLETALPSFEELCRVVVQRYGGHLEQRAGDTHVAYFGYPDAHEDDARRSVLAGLSILEGLKRLNADLARDRSLRLSARLGIHTGTVVVKGDRPGAEGGARIVGDASSVATRLAALARADSLLISEATERLVEGLFECAEGPGRLEDGSSGGGTTREVLHESAARNRLEAEEAIRGLSPLVGREKELGLLLERWREAVQGRGQVVLLSGEAGLGKSRLALEVKKHVAQDPRAWLTELACSAYHTNSAFRPIIDFCQRVILQFEDAEAPESRLRKLEGFLAQYGLKLAEAVPLFAALLSIPPGDAYPPLNLPPERQKHKVLADLVHIVLSRAAEQPLLLVVEDLHWADPSTLEFLGLLLEQVAASPALALLTCRPEFTPPWPLRSHFAYLPLTRLGSADCASLVTGVSRGRTLSSGVFTEIVAKSDGVPLFVEEMTKTMLESDGATTPGRRDIPKTLQASLLARLDRLGGAKEVAQLAAVLGREFPYEWLRTVSIWDEDVLEASLERLVGAELLFKRGLHPRLAYQFKHALIEDAAYQSLPKEKRQAFHRQVAERLSAAFPELARSSPELLGHHFAAAGLPARAVPLWLKAGERAIQRAANAEASGHLRRGLELLSSLPDDPGRDVQELPLQMNLGLAVMASRGYAAPETAAAFRRAREICRKLGDPPPTFPALHGLFRFHLVRAEYGVAGELGAQLTSMAAGTGSADLEVEAAWAQSTVLFWTGQMARARAGLERGLTFYDREQHQGHAALYGQDPKVATLSYLGWALAILGHTDLGLSRVDEAVALARELNHAFSLGFALHCSSIVRQLRRDVAATLERTQEQIAICTELGFPFWAAGGAILRGWALCAQGSPDEGAPLMREGLEGWLATGAELARPYYLQMIADALRGAGRLEEARQAVEEGLSCAEKTGEAHYLAELHRIQGELTRLRGKDALDAAASFERALDIARRQEARTWELRAAHSLLRLRAGTPAEAEARSALARTCATFDEGLETPDVREARLDASP